MDKEVLQELARRFGTDIGRLRLLHQNSRNTIYGYELSGGKFVLKVTHRCGSDIDSVKGKLDWINYLYDNGVRVPRIVPSRNDEWLEVTGGHTSCFLAFSYEKVESYPSGTSDRNADLIQKLGRLMGRMHMLTKDYTPPNRSLKRPERYETVWLSDPDTALHPSQSVVIKKCHELQEKLSKFNADRHSYGLIHDDLHMGNLIISNGEITAIDFECCHYTWLVSDIASSLLFAIWKEPDKELEPLRQFAVHFMKNLMEGYNRENHIDAYWIEQMPLFLKLREMSLYVSWYSDWDVNDVSPGQRIFFYRKCNVENDIPYIDIDFARGNISI